MKNRFASSTVWVLALLGSACATDDGDGVSNEFLEPTVAVEPVPSTSTPSRPEAESAATALPPEKSATAPVAYDWTAPLIGGGSIDLAGYSNSAVVLWFWAPY